MKKIEAITLEEAYQNATTIFNCSINELSIEVVQVPSNGFLGLFKKKAIIVATVKKNTIVVEENKKVTDKEVSNIKQEDDEEEIVHHSVINNTIMPASFVSDQDDEEDEDLGSGLDYTADYDDEYDEEIQQSGFSVELDEIIDEVQTDINELFKSICFNIDKIEVSAYDEETLLIEFKGEDAALLIGKEGYRYKALSYMIFNWINTKYELQLRLEIAEFLKNQEESVARYLDSVYENIDRDGRSQTKILDGVLVQIALKELRDRYPDKYVVIRTTKDGLKYIIINDYHN